MLLLLVGCVAIGACSLATDLTAPGAMIKYTGDMQTAAVNTALPAPLAIIVVNQFGDRLKNVTEVKTARIQLTIEDMKDHESASEEKSHHSMPQAPRAGLYIPNTAEILTRPFEVEDHSCGNEVVEYAPLSKGVTATPAYTLAHAFKGKALNTTWNDPNCRSSFVGHFAR